MRLKLCGVVIAVALAVAGCGNSSTKTSTSRQTARATTTDTTRATTLFYVNKYPKPANPGPHPGARVDQLVIRDVRKGVGPVIHAGDSGVFEFIATNWVTGRTLEASWHRRRPFETQIEHNVVIDGWWQGIPGMRVGGRRQILVPPSLGFTNNPNLSGSTTYFDVVLNEVIPQRPAGLGGGRTTPQVSTG